VPKIADKPSFQHHRLALRGSLRQNVLSVNSPAEKFFATAIFFEALMQLAVSCVLSLGLWMQAPATASAEDSAPPDSERAAAIKRFQEEARKYVLVQDTARPGKLEFLAEPVLHWANPARNGEDGAVFVWTRNGRPEAIGSVFTYTNSRTGAAITKHAFHSLSDAPLSAEYESKAIWAPQAAGLAFQAVPDSEPPADSPRRRLVQMRSMARDFSAKIVDLVGEASELRLLTQPIVRYEPTAGRAKDGAIFAFAVGTDPEVLLVLESREHSGEQRWEYAFARSHFVELTAFHGGKEVWKAERDEAILRTTFGSDDQRGKIYYSVVRP
jgi:hypothetical protein